MYEKQAGFNFIYICIVFSIDQSEERRPEELLHLPKHRITPPSTSSIHDTQESTPRSSPLDRSCNTATNDLVTSSKVTSRSMKSTNRWRIATLAHLLPLRSRRRATLRHNPTSWTFRMTSSTTFVTTSAVLCRLWSQLNYRRTETQENLLMTF